MLHFYALFEYLSVGRETNPYMISIMTYKASMDNAAKGITAGVSVLFAVIIIAQFSLIPQTGWIIPVCVTAGLVIIYIVLFGFKPAGYRITEKEITIRRLFGDVQIDRQQIKSITVIDREELRWSLRLFGVGGVFGYFGTFANRKIGKMTWYATRRNTPVLLITIENKKIILTPDDPVQFVAVFERLGKTTILL